MPRTKGGAVPRRNIRIPKPMMDEVERIVAEHPELYNNRQQFIESAIRETIEKYVFGNPRAQNDPNRD